MIRLFSFHYLISDVLFFQERAVGVLLRLREVKDEIIRSQAHEALALLGWSDPVKGRGVRILALDGGGTRLAISSIVEIAVC